MKQIMGWELAHLFPLWVYVKPEVNFNIFGQIFRRGLLFHICLLAAEFHWRGSWGALGGLLGFEGEGLKTTTHSPSLLTAVQACFHSTKVSEKVGLGASSC